MREMRTPLVVASWIALGAGVLGAIQPRINATLAERAGSAVAASWVNFAGAWLIISGVVVARRRTRDALRRIGDWGVPWFVFTAGIGGVFAVLSGALAANVLGIAIFSVAFYSGQLISSLVVDRSGLRAGDIHAITAPRLYGAALAIVAVAVTQVGRPVGEVRTDLIAVVIAAGAGTSFQAAFNGRMAASARDPFAATAINVSGGLLALTFAAALMLATGAMAPPRLPSEPLLYTGGLLGVAIVASFAVTTLRLGVLRSTMAMLAGQLATALLIDWLTGTEPTIGVLAGTVLISIAVSMVGRQLDATRRTVSK